VQRALGMRAILLVSLALAPLGCKDLVVPLGDGSASSAVTSDAGPEDPTIDWPDASRAVAKDLMRTYGAPEDAAAGMLLWGARGPFKRMTVFKDPVPHNFPQPHADVVEQVVDAKIPAGKVGELAMFSGSLLVDRTKGELAARCADEQTNMLLLNLAMDVVNGAKTADQARQALAVAAAAGEYPAKLAFDPPQGDQGDPDVAAQ
jgi:hypothetical protein